MIDMSPEAITARIREVGRLSDFSPEERLSSKLDMSPHGVTSRLREAAQLLVLCERLGALGRATD